MQLPAHLTTLAALLSVTAAAPSTPAKRDPLITQVTSMTFSPEFNTCTVNPTTITIQIGNACGLCKPLTPAQKSISVTQLEPKCRVTVYNTDDCSDPGIVSGTAGCWSPPGGALAYRVDCPWYFPDVRIGEPRACSWVDAPEEPETGGGDGCSSN